MPRTAWLRVAALAVVLALLAPPVFARSRAFVSPARELRGFLVSVVEVVTNLLPGLDKGRAGMDPNGSPTAPTTTTSTEDEETDGRASMDPNGQP
jgi:hypothetical protein